METSVNTKKLRYLIETRGGRRRVATESGLGYSTLTAWCSGNYSARPGASQRRTICEYFNLPQEEIFPFMKKERDEALSAS